MYSPYDLITITKVDLNEFQDDPFSGKIGSILNLVFDELPKDLKQYAKFTDPHLKPIQGFEDNNIKGYEIIIRGNTRIERFVRDYIPFVILKKSKNSKSINPR